MSDINEQDYLKCTFTDSRGRKAQVIFVRYPELGKMILDWMGQEAAGEVTVTHDKTDFGEDHAPIYP